MQDESSNPQEQTLQSVFTASLAEILAQLNISLAVTTYQAGKVILVRYDGNPGTNGSQSPPGIVNTHFRNFPNPWGWRSMQVPRGRAVVWPVGPNMSTDQSRQTRSDGVHATEHKNPLSS